MRRLRWRCSIAGLVPVVLAMLWPALSRAENENAFPQRPMRIIVAGSVGSADDFFARTLADELERYYRQRVLVDSRAGAGGLIGNTLVSKANPDGYTMGMVSVTRLITALMREQPPHP